MLSKSVDYLWNDPEGSGGRGHVPRPRAAPPLLPSLRGQMGGEGACAEDKPLSVPSMLGWGLGPGWKEWAVLGELQWLDSAFASGKNLWLPG